MARRAIGDLTLGTSRIGSFVRCVRTPDISFWEQYAPRQKFDKPVQGTICIVRANVVVPHGFDAPYEKGVLVSRFVQRQGFTATEPIVNPGVTHRGDPKGEPFFAFDCFMLLSGVPPTSRTFSRP